MNKCELCQELENRIKDISDNECDQYVNREYHYLCLRDRILDRLIELALEPQDELNNTPKSGDL